MTLPIKTRCWWLYFNQTPNKQTPNKQTPNKQTPNKQTPNKQTPNQQTPNKQTPNKQTPNKQTPIQNPGKLRAAHSRYFNLVTFCDFTGYKTKRNWQSLVQIPRGHAKVSVLSGFSY